jgi:type III secretion protein L
VSKKKLLTLIHGGDLHLAPGTKVVPADQFSELVNSSETLQKVQEDAHQFRIEETEKIEQQREQAVQDGFAEGLDQWAAQIKRLEEEIVRVHNDLEKLVIPVAIKAAKKIVGNELQLSKEAIVDIVSTTLKAVSHHRLVTVHVSPEDLEILDKKRPQLKQIFDRLESLSLVARDDIERGGCIIETETGIINAELEHQWTRLEQAIESLMKGSEKSP